MSNTRTIAKNTGWYGLESSIGLVVTLFTSIAIARTLGPTKMGYMVYVMWISSMVSSLGSIGVPATTRKYMAEFLGMGDRGTARHIYLRTLLLQMVLATAATAGILFWLYKDAQPGYFLASALIALSIWPSMVNFVSSQANVAAETLSANLPGSVASILVFFIAILATVIFGWGVIGVGASILLMRCVDFLVRLIPTLGRITTWNRSYVTPHGLNTRMMSFAWQSVASMVLAIIVWDRSEFLLLKHFCSDIRQVAFYSVAFSMAERLLVSASVFGSASGATIFAQYGRDKSRLANLGATSFRYLALTSIPLHFIASALAAPALLLLYGSAYQGAAVVVVLSPLLCLPKAFLSPAQSLLESAEKQNYVIFATVLAGIADLGVAWWLIPAHGAVGACIGSGAAQIMAVGFMWAICISFFRVQLAWMHLVKIVSISIAAALTAHFIAAVFAPLPGIVLGGTAALAVLISLMYLLRVLEPVDLDRLSLVCSGLPASIGLPLNRLLAVLVRGTVPAQVVGLDSAEEDLIPEQVGHD